MSGRQTMVAVAIVTGLVVGGAGAAFAGESDDQGDIVSELTGRLTGGSDAVRDAPDADGAFEGRSSGEEAGGFKEVQQALTGGDSSLLRTGDELLDPVNEAVCSLTDDEFELLGLDPVEVLGDCPADAEVKRVEIEKKGVEDVEKDEPEKKDEPDGNDDPDQEDRPDDDSGTVPVGGIETGGGGTATTGPPAALGSGIILSAVAGSALAWRRAGRFG